MSDPPLPDIGFKNKMTLVRTALKNLGPGLNKSKNRTKCDRCQIFSRTLGLKILIFSDLGPTHKRIQRFQTRTGLANNLKLWIGPHQDQNKLLNLGPEQNLQILRILDQLGPVGPWITGGNMKLPRVTNSLLKPNS